MAETVFKSLASIYKISSLRHYTLLLGALHVDQTGLTVGLNFHQVLPPDCESMPIQPRDGQPILCLTSQCPLTSNIKSQLCSKDLAMEKVETIGGYSSHYQPLLPFSITLYPSSLKLNSSSVWCIILLDLQILYQPGILEINPT